jgi:hypothetical protein
MALACQQASKATAATCGLMMLVLLHTCIVVHQHTLLLAFGGSDDTDCYIRQWCSYNKTGVSYCAPLLSSGTSCTRDRQCGYNSTTGRCVDGKCSGSAVRCSSNGGCKGYEWCSGGRCTWRSGTNASCTSNTQCYSNK